MAAAPDPALKPMLAAAKKGDVETMKRLHSDGLPLDASDRFDNHALAAAVKAGKIEAVQWLLAAGARTPLKVRRGTGGYTGMHSVVHCVLAAQHGRLDVLKLLLRFGGHTFENIREARRAAANSNRGPVLAFLEQAVDEAWKSRGLPPTPGSIEYTVDALQRCGSHDNPLSLSQLDDALKHPMIEYLVNMDIWGMTALHRCIVGKCLHVDLVQRLLQAPGIRVDARDETGSTPLLLLCSDRYFVLGGSSATGQIMASKVKLLLAAGADIRARNNEGNTVLHCFLHTMIRKLRGLIWSDEWAVIMLPHVKQLVEAGAPLVARCKEGKSLLDLAERYDDRIPTSVREYLRTRVRVTTNLRKWRVAGRVAGVLAVWHERAAERVYMPKGAGFEIAQASFEERVVRQRTS